MARRLTTVAVLFLAFGVLVNTFFLVKGPSESLSPTYPHVNVTFTREKEAIEALSAVVRCPTVGDRESSIHVSQPGPFLQLHVALKVAYPSLWNTVQVEKINTFSLLFTWPGSDKSLRPLLLISHMDVVPAPPDNWTVDPYSGLVDDEFIWGRGTLDTKGSAIAILEAWEQLRSEGWTPQRTLLFGLGHDEEMEGIYGAAQISRVVEERYPEGLELILDEGGFTLNDGLGAASQKVFGSPIRMAAVGLAEKGKLSWDVAIRGAGGHSSLPPPRGASTASILGRLLTKLDERALPVRLEAPTTDFLKALAPYVKFSPLSWLLSNCENGIINPLLGRLLAASAKTSFMVRTAHGVTGAGAGGKARNALPTSASVTVDFRPLAGGGDEVTTFIHSVIAEVSIPPSASITAAEFHAKVPASHVTPAKGHRFEIVRRAILETLNDEDKPPLVVAPYLMSGGTDSKNYERLAHGRIFRYEPFALASTDLSRLHGVNERIPIASFLQGIKFYIRFIQLAAGSSAHDE